MVHNAHHLYTQPELQTIINAAYPAKDEALTFMKVFCRNNPDGTIRWAWPAQAKQPGFLHFYHKGSFRARCMAFFMRVLFMLRLQRLLASSEAIVSVPKSSPLAGFNWALFTGTPGPNRKAVLRLEENGSVVYVKVPLGEQALVRLKNEAQAFFWLKCNPVCGLVVPESLHTTARLSKLGDVAAGNTKTVSEIADLPYATLLEWLTGNIQATERRSAGWWQQAVEKIGRLQYSTDKRVPRQLIDKTHQLMRTVYEQESVHISPAHGDFTPWNMCVKDSRLMVWDWEMFGTSYPALFDAFHFIYQEAVLVRREDYKSIRRRVDQFFDSPCCRSFIEKNDIDVEALERHYLITVVTTLLTDWTRQDTWHAQTAWLINVWNDALNDLITLEDPSQYRKLLLRDLFSSIRMQQYAWMKACGKLPWEIDEWSDIDLCASRRTTAYIKRVLLKHQLVKRVSSTQFFHRTVFSVILVNGDFLSLDCIHRFKRRATEYLDAHAVAEKAVLSSDGIRYASLGDDLKYAWLFSVLNGSELSQRYRLYFVSRYAVHEGTLNEAARALGATAFIPLLQGDGKNSIAYRLAGMPANKGVKAVVNKAAYLADVLRAWFVSPGFTVTFSGIDGAGKSTVIDIMKERIARRTRRRVVVLRHRPSVLPILSVWRDGRKSALQKAAASLPTTATASGSLSSLFRFAYYYADYFLGQFYVFFRHILRGEVVIYDRYYFDFINNPERSNLQLPSRFITLFYTFLLKPDYNFFLYAPVDVIYARKQELSKGIMQTIMNRYLGFFSKASEHEPKRYVSVQNLDLKQTVAQVESIIFGGNHEELA